MVAFRTRTLLVADSGASPWARIRGLGWTEVEWLEARTAEEALERSRAPDLAVAIIDLSTRGLDAAGLVRRLRRDPGRDELPVLLMGGDGGLPALEEDSAAELTFLELATDPDELRARLQLYGQLAAQRAELKTLRAELQEQRAVKESHGPAALTRRVLDELFAFVGVLTTDGTLIETNRAPLEAAGLAPEDVIGKKFWECYWWSHSVQTQDDLQQACARARRGETVRYDVEARMKDSALVWVDLQIAPLRDAASHVTHLVPSGFDITERKRAEQRLCESEKRFRAAFDSAPVGIAHVGFDGRWLLFNRALCVITGYTPEELLARTFAEITHPADVAADWALAERLRAGEFPAYRMEKRYLRRDGSVVWVSLTGSLLRNAAGEAEHFIAIVEDIQARKRAEEALRQSEQRLAAILEHLPLGVGLSDLDGHWVVSNSFMRRYVPHTVPSQAPDAETRWHVRDSNGAEVPRTEWPAARAMRGESVTPGLEMVLETGTGAAIWMSVSALPLRGAYGNVLGAIVVVQNIDWRKRAEEALRQSEERFRQLAESMPQLVWTARPDGVVDYYNHQIQKYAGARHTPDGVWEWEGLLHPEDQGVTAEAWERALQTGAGYQVEHRVQMRDGSYRWHLSRAHPGRDATGQTVKWFGTATDIEEQKRAQELLERKVRERTARLQDTIGELEAFSYSIAHDLRAPLRSIKGFSDILVDDFADALPAEARDYLQRISASAGRMDQLILDVLNYGKVVRGDATITTVDVNRLLAEIIDSYPVFREKSADVQVAPGLPRVLGNEAMLTQVFSNLLGNAVKFIAEGVAPVVRVYGETRSGRARIWVRDNGIGITASQHERIFGIFQRLDKTYEGTGIGLAIVQKAMQRMGGAVGVESEPGAGSAFWIELPDA